jgi:hypothetical protein
VKNTVAVEGPKHISREELDAALKKIFDEVTARKLHGETAVSYQGGNFRVINLRESINKDSLNTI